MSVGFGFSAGDFIAALGLVKTVISALEDSGNVGAEYRELLGELRSLETALIGVKRLELDESQYAECIALRQAAAQCQRTIDDFWTKTDAYNPHLNWGIGSGRRWKDRWAKVRWAVCKKDDIAKFKVDLMMHTQSIQTLLITLQLYVLPDNQIPWQNKPTSLLQLFRAKFDLQRQKQDSQRRSLTTRVQQSYSACMEKLSKYIPTNQSKDPYVC